MIMTDKDERPNDEEEGQFEIGSDGVDVEQTREGKQTVQDLLTVVQKAELREALPQAMILSELNAVAPLPYVHCERVFSRMKRVVASGSVTMLEKRKEIKA